MVWRKEAAMPGLLWASCWMNNALAHPQRLSRHLLLEDLPMVVLLAEAIQTPGPFAERDIDYVTNTNDLTAAGRAGSPGIVGGDRLTVVDGVPLTLNITVYDVSNPSVGGIELPNVEVFLWHTDAAGVYSAVGDNRQELEDTAGQVWCRGIQNTNDLGVATFQTIMPGWYPGRAIHYHLRLRLPGQQENEFAATTQLYVGDDDLRRYSSVVPYSTSPYPVTPLNFDNIFNRLNNAIIQEMLTLSLGGSVRTGFSSSIALGVVPPEGYTLQQSPTSRPTTMPTTIPPTNSPTTKPTPATEQVPRPTFAFETPTPAITTTIMPSTAASNNPALSEQPTAFIQVLPDSTNLPGSSSSVVSGARQRNPFPWVAAGVLGAGLLLP